jgi:hypothetical protein
MKLKLTDKNQQIYFSNTGEYKVIFDGIIYASNNGDFKIEIINNSNDEILNVRIPYFKKKGHKNVHFAYFDIREKGNYTINFLNINDLSIKYTLLWTYIFFPSKYKPENIVVLIEKSY